MRLPTFIRGLACLALLSNSRARAQGPAQPQPQPANLVDAAKAEATQAKEEAKESKAALDLAQSGKLMSSGVTAGVALAVQLPMPLFVTDYGQKAGDVVAMPYLFVLPGYFGAPQTVREYCASAWGIGDDSKATAAATAVARKGAQRLFEAIRSDLKVGRNPSAVAAAWFSEELPEQQFGADIIRRLVELDRPQQPPKTQAEVEALETAIVDSLANHAWNPTLRGKCLGRSFGVWLGRPLTYDTTTRLSVDAERVGREVKPVVAFGVGYTPHAYLAFLLGVTYASVEFKDAAGATTERPLWTSTLAVGGNLDLVAYFLTKR